MHIVVIGGGAAGFFAALSAKAHDPQARVQLLEKSNKLLAKVRVSGGGRCNVTHHLLEPRKLAQRYPRGEKFMKKALAQWSVKDTIAWFEGRGAELKTEEDGRMFPVTDSSQTIVDALVKEAMKTGVEVKLNCGVKSITPLASGFSLILDNSERIEADRVIVTTGGHPKADGYAWLAALGLPIVPPVPSLFTFNLIDKRMAELMGVVAPKAIVRIPALKLEAEGPVLITHWGLSGPAVLRLSAWGARELLAVQYRYIVHVNWIGLKEEAARIALNAAWETNPKKQAINACPFELPERLWGYLLDKSGIAATKPCADVGKHDRNRLLDILVNDKHPAQGKTTFKEEFVTAGGVALEAVDPDTLASLAIPGLFFAGEVLDIDGITGGFNFQAAWTTGWIAGKHASLP
ncbi:MAG: NAD(P)/FAD-dependent oxidoreductase [Flavobacteriales bacterium]